MPTQARLEHDTLARQIRRANDEYYRLGAPTLSDAEYDALMTRLKALEEAHPDLRTADSPTQLVGAPVERTLFPKARHLEPMLSLANAFSEADLERWAERELVEDANSTPLFCDLKIDGLSLALTYVRGKLACGVTRGNGVEGDDVTANVRTIRGIPAHLPGGWITGGALPVRFEIRGECYMPRSVFAQLNVEREAAGDEPFSNPRNAAAGSLRQIDPTVTARRPIRFFGYAMVLPDGAPLPLETQSALYEQLQAWGFEVAPLYTAAPNREAVDAFVDDVAAKRDALDFDIDGVVVKVNSLARQRAMGAVGRDPRWGIARKWPAQVVETTLLAIGVQVGRTGRQTPVARLKPVLCGGVMVENVTLHNEDFIRGLDLRIGDTVRLTRAGEVIPQILGPVVEARTGAERVWQFPTTCASCQGPLERLDDAADWTCTSLQCPAQLVRRIMHYGSRSGVDIRGMGSEIAARLAEAGLVRTVADLYRLGTAEFGTLPGFAAASAENLAAAIAATKSRPLTRVLYGLGIPYVGNTLSEALVAHFGSMEAIQQATVEELVAVEAVGPERAAAIRNFFTDPVTGSIVSELRSVGVEMPSVAPKRGAATGTLAGCTVVVTGTLSEPREAVERRLKEAGAKVSGSVSAKTSFLVAGRDAGSKLEKATALGVRIVSEDELPGVLSVGVGTPAQAPKGRSR